MTEAFLEAYFKNIATKSKDILNTDDAQAFYRMANPMDLDEFDNAVRNMTKPTCLLLEIGTGTAGEWDSQKEIPRIGLHLLNKSDNNSPDNINAARDAAKATLYKIVSQMRLDCKDQYNRPDNADGPLKTQNVSFDTKISFSNMSAVDGNWYGKSFYFNFGVPLDLRYNSDDWLA